MLLVGVPLRRGAIERRRTSALLAYRNARVAAELTRAETLLRESPPQTISDVSRLVGVGPSTCGDKDEPGPLDDPRTEQCPPGSGCHQAFFRADWYVRRHIESPDTRVWFDASRDNDGVNAGLQVRVTGCNSDDRVVKIDPLERPRFSLAEW